MRKTMLRVGVVGAGHWAQTAHIPSFLKCPEVRIVAICDTNEKLARETALRFNIPDVCLEYHDLLNREDIDVIDICSSADSHFQIALESIKRKKSILCEKPLAKNYKEARELAEKVRSFNARAKMGFTFRYSPALRRAKELIDEGFIGQPYLFNGFEQNSQFIDPMTPFRWNPNEDQKIMPGSLEEYAPHMIDIALWFLGDIKQVVGNLRNFIPVRYIRDRGKTMPINMEDVCVCLADFANGVQATLQSSFIAIGGYPGLEIRVFGSRGAIIARLVEERGVKETLKVATTDNTEFCEVEIPPRLCGSGNEEQSWVGLYFSNLVRAFVTEIIEEKEPEANFSSGARAQEVEDAIYLSHLERRWVSLPLRE